MSKPEYDGAREQLGATGEDIARILAALQTLPGGGTDAEGSPGLNEFACPWKSRGDVHSPFCSN